MSRNGEPSWVPKARKLREKGLTYQQIADALGGVVVNTTVRRRLDADAGEADRQRARDWKARNREKVRAYDAAYAADSSTRAVCEKCAGPMQRSRGDAAGNGVCLECRVLIKEAHWQRIEELWATGASLREIGAAMGRSKGHLASEFGRMRNAGRDLPLRYRMRDGKRVAA